MLKGISWEEIHISEWQIQDNSHFSPIVFIALHLATLVIDKNIIVAKSPLNIFIEDRVQLVCMKYRINIYVRYK